MSELLLLIPRVAIIFGGAAAGLISALWKSLEGGGVAQRRAPAPMKTTAPVEVGAWHGVLQTRLTRLEKLVEQHEQRLRSGPTQEIIAAMNQVFDRSTTALDERFAEQARSIESLKLIVSRTDELLDKVLDSIYSLPDSHRNPGAGRDDASLSTQSSEIGKLPVSTARFEELCERLIRTGFLCHYPVGHGTALDKPGNNE